MATAKASERYTTSRVDIHGRSYFKRPDGRAIPTLGYQLEDMTDDYDAPRGRVLPRGRLDLERRVTRTGLA